LITFSEIAEKYLNNYGYEAYICASEDEARNMTDTLLKDNKWPCYFFKSDTSGEKDFEEFYTGNEILDMNVYENIGIVKNNLSYDKSKLDNFVWNINNFKDNKSWNKEKLVELFNETLDDFNHLETGKYLDDRM